MRYIGPGSEPVEGHDYTATLEFRPEPGPEGWVGEPTGNASFVCQCGAATVGPSDDVRTFAFAHFAEHRPETPADRVALQEIDRIVSDPPKPEDYQ